jgi:sugar lactone lactonase YvrE
MAQHAFWKKFVCTFALIVFAGSLLSHAAEQSGVVQTGPAPIRFSSVTLYKAGPSSNASPVVLGSTQTDATGAFSIAFNYPSNDKTILYLIADGGIPATVLSTSAPSRPEIQLTTVLGPTPIPAGVVINERTTVAAAYALAQFIFESGISGKSPGLQNAAATMMNLVDPVTGTVGSVLETAPNGLSTSTLLEFNSLANLLSTCVNAATDAPCASLFALATPPGGTAPRNTLQAAVNIAHFPWQNPTLLFLQSKLGSPYGPALSSAPNAWTLALVYEGNGHEFDGPGNMSIDTEGNVWSTNNYMYNSSSSSCAVGGRQVLKLTPTGADAPGAPYSGGGLYGAGFGIALDPSGNAWVANFGFQGVDNGVPCDPNPPQLSISEFSSNGSPLSPSTGFTQGDISQPQGTVSDQQGNIWIANCGNNSVTEFPKGNPGRARNFAGVGLLRPFGLAVDGDSNTWITSSGNQSVVGLTPRGTVITGSPIDVGSQEPLGIAVDSHGNVWTANSGVIDLPCGDSSGGVVTPSGRASITRITRSGNSASATNFTGGGLTVPWGIAIDGDDNVWVANFAGQRVSEFCGSTPSNCPYGSQTGDAISPRSGYDFNGLTRNTGLAIDASGNIWLANNWLTVPVQTNPGGHSLVVFIGLAAPIQTPLIGPPHRP